MVYIVLINYENCYDKSTEIEGVYSTLQQAQNSLSRLQVEFEENTDSEDLEIETNTDIEYYAHTFDEYIEIQIIEKELK